MKRLFFVLIAVFICSVSFGQKYYNKTESDARYNKVIDNINPHDSVWFKDETYHKDTINSKLSKKANLYQPALVNPTANTLPAGTNTTGLATTAFVAGEIVNKRDGVVKQLQSLGMSIKAIPWNCTLFAVGNITLVDGTVNLVLLDDITETTVVTGLKNVATATAGNFTEDNFCGAALYSVSNGVYTQIAISANLPAQMKLSANTAAVYPFTAPITLQPGKYVAALLYNSSAQTTAPSVYSCSSTVNGVQLAIGLTVARICSTLAGQATMPSSITASSTTFASATHFLYLY